MYGMEIPGKVLGGGGGGVTVPIIHDSHTSCSWFMNVTCRLVIASLR